MFQLKKISIQSIPEALEKAERYRLLNEPRLAESICLDILEADPKNIKAIIIRILAITDQFGYTSSPDLNEARRLTDQLPDEYDRNYYSGIICERKGKSCLAKDVPDSHFTAYEWFRDALEFFQKAESLRPSANDDAILRWNTCVRLITRYRLKPRDEKYMELPLE